MFAVGQQVIGSKRSGGEDNTVCGEAFPALEHPSAWALGGDPVASAAIGRAQGDDIDHLMLGQDARTEFLGEPQVVFQQRVFGTDPASHHARAAMGATGALRALAAEIGVADGFTRLSEVDGARCATERIFGAIVVRHLKNQALVGRFKRHGLHPQHVLGGIVMRLQGTLPIAGFAPLLVVEKLGLGAVQGIGINQTTAANARTTAGKDVLERGQAQYPF
jgi:hypothetical protein